MLQPASAVALGLFDGLSGSRCLSGRRFDAGCFYDADHFCPHQTG